MARTEGKVAATNRKAWHDYFIKETYEVGIVLQGTEIKSIRQGNVNIKDSFARVSGGEVFLHNMHIGIYEYGNRYNHEPTRTRKLLLHKKEIAKLAGTSQQTGHSLIPLKVYITRGHAKVLLALAQGKRKYDKREALKRKTAKRDIERALKERDRM